MFWYISFSLSWIIWFLCADKTRWRELLPVSFIATMFALTTDILVQHYPLWEFICECPIPEITHAFGIYIVVPYLFVQWLPQKQTFIKMLFYWFVWTGFTFIVEYIYVKTGHMYYPLWWRIYHSYIANWVLFFIFYQYYKVFEFRKLSR